MKTYWDYDEINDKEIIETVQDVEPILEANKRLYNNPSHRQHGVKHEFAHVAHIPMILVHKWLMEGIDVYKESDWPRVKRKLEDPDYKYLRTTNLKL